MIVGEVRTISRTVTFEEATAFDTPVELSVIYPDDTIDTPSVTTVPGTEAIEQELIAQVEFDIGGPYYTTFTCDAGNDDIIKLLDIYFAAYTDVYSFIRTEMGKSAAQLTDAAIDFTLSALLRKLYASFPTLRRYDLLTDRTEQMNMDEALSYLVMLRASQGTIQLAPEGELIMYQFEQTKYQFQPTSGDKVGRKDQWLQNAMLAFQRIPEIKEIYTTRMERKLGFYVAGPSRARARRVDQSLYGNTASLLSDTLDFSTADAFWGVL